MKLFAFALIVTSVSAAPLSFSTPSRRALPTPVDADTARQYLAERDYARFIGYLEPFGFADKIVLSCCGHRLQHATLRSQPLPNLGYHLWQM